MAVEGISAGGQDARPGIDRGLSFEDARNLRIEFDRETNARIDDVQDATTRVARHEADLQRNLEQGVHLATGLDAEAFSAQARAHPDYAALREASSALTSYLAEQFPQVQAAIEPSMMYGREGLLVEMATDALDKAVCIGAATPSMLSDLGTLAGHVSAGTDAGLRVLEGALDTRLGGLLSATGTALGVAGATVTLADGVAAIDNGTADAGTHLQMAGAAGTLVSAGLAVAGAARVATPVGLGATAVGYTGQFLSSVAENGRVFEGTVDSLVASGLPQEVAHVVASAPAGTLQVLQSAGGLDAAQIQALAMQAPAALRAPPEAVQALLDNVPLRGDALAGFLAATAPDTGLVLRGATEVGMRGLPAGPESLATHLDQTRHRNAEGVASAIGRLRASVQ